MDTEIIEALQDNGWLEESTNTSYLVEGIGESEVVNEPQIEPILEEDVNSNLEVHGVVNFEQPPLGSLLNNHHLEGIGFQLH